MRHPIRLVAAAVLATAIAVPAQLWAGPEKVEFPADYKKWTSFGVLDRYDGKAVRFLYANPAAMNSVPGNAANGSVLVLEVRKAKLGADGNPERGADGRFIATDEVTAVNVQEKRAGWGTEYPEAKRNGEWEYASFQPSGQRNAGANIDGCFSCHKPWVGQDFTFIFDVFVRDGKPK